MGDKRLHYIDVLKGIGIIFVILSHASMSSIITNYLFSFHMPLFFFISGYLFTIKDNFRSVILKKVKTLLIPYICFILIADIIYSLLNNNFNLFFLLEKTFYLKGEVLQLDAPLWFLPCLFFSEIIYLLVYKLTNKDNKKILGILFLISVLGYFSKVLLPFGIHVAFTATVFLGLGNLYRQYESKIKASKYLLFALFIISGIISIKNGFINMYRLSFGNYFLFYIAAIIGIVIYFEISKFIKGQAILEYIGKNSLIFMSTHMFIMNVLLKLYQQNIDLKQNLFVVNILGVIFAITAIVASVPIVYIINNYMPFIIGKRNLISEK